MKAKVTYIIVKEVEFDEDEMREYGIEGEITDEMKLDYLDTLICDEYNINERYDKKVVTILED